MFSRNRFGLIGIIFALLGLSAAIFHDQIQDQKPAIEISMTERIFNKGIEIFDAKKEDKAEISYVLIAQLALGFIGIILGVISWIRHETHRVAIAAVTLGVIAIAWEYFLIALMIALIILILGNLA